MMNKLLQREKRNERNLTEALDKKEEYSYNKSQILFNERTFCNGCIIFVM